MTRRIGILGGTFDPPHLGHLMMARDAYEQLALSHVIFVPAASPPHKQHLALSAAEHRLQMLQAAVKGDTRFSVSDIEVRREGLSYSVDTVEHLATVHKEAQLVFIIGSDTLLEMHTWHRIEDLLSLCSIATVLRPGSDSLETLRGQLAIPEAYRETAMQQIIHMHPMDISSSNIRCRVAAGESVCYLLPPAVEQYIEENGLYRN